MSLDRLLYGPEPPVGKPYTPRAHWRCAIGLHRRSEVWSFTTLSHRIDGRNHEKLMALNLDRPPDHVRCVWCGRVW
jgi:hypothetical protein